MNIQQYKKERIKKIIDNYEYVSFDIFDTLIKRNVIKPTDVFELVAKEYKRIYGKEIENYKQIRMNAEINARKNSVNKEPNLNEIYNNISIKGLKSVKELEKIEIAIELDICQKNIDFFDIYQYCCHKNKKIIITSDMYLNKEDIKKILIKNGIDKYEYLFLSNDIKMNKHQGKIYPYILKKLGIKSSQIVHIGDSKRGDYIMPRKYGIKAILIPKDINKLKYYYKANKDKKLNFEYNTIEKFINNNICLDKSEYYKIGYETLGIILYGYTKWLISELKKKNIDKVFFLSREGYLLKQVFDLINDSNIESRYLYVSRRSVRVSLLKNIEKPEDVFNIIKMKKNTDLNSFFLNLGLDINFYSNILKKYNCNSNDNIYKIDNINKVIIDIKEDIIENAKQEEIKLLEYLKQEKFYGKLAVSDVGWVGTMQNSLNIILRDKKVESDIYGFYIAEDKNEQNKNKIRIKSYAYLSNFNEIRPCIHLFENLFLAQHGTTIKYSYDKEKIVPVLDKYEYDKDAQEKFLDIQNGAIQFVQDIIKINYFRNNKLNSQIVNRNLNKLTLYPTLNDVKLFKGIKYKETTESKLISNKGILYYFFNIKEFYDDFYKSGWKIGFLKSVFKVNMPYYNVYNYIKNKE